MPPPMPSNAMSIHSSVTIRDADLADVAALQAIYAHHVRHGTASFEIEPPDCDEMARRRDDVVARGLSYLVAELDRHVVGYGYAAPYRLRPAYRYTVENSIYVASNLSGRGIGRAILTELIARCEAAGLRRMVAVIGDSANAASIGLHEALGFELVGVLPGVGFKFGRWIDSVLMQRALGDGATKPPDSMG